MSELLTGGYVRRLSRPEQFGIVVDRFASGGVLVRWSDYPQHPEVVNPDALYPVRLYGDPVLPGYAMAIADDDVHALIVDLYRMRDEAGTWPEDLVYARVRGFVADPTARPLAPDPDEAGAAGANDLLSREG